MTDIPQEQPDCSPEFSVSLSPDITAESNGIHNGVYEERGSTQHPLQFAGQRFGVEHRQQIMLNEAGSVGRSATLLSEPIFEGRERANPEGSSLFD